jgi:hypothetical protein
LAFVSAARKETWYDGALETVSVGALEAVSVGA